MIVNQIENLVFEKGGSVVGYACIREIKNKFNLPPALLDGFDYAISVGLGLNQDILKTNIDSPSHFYKHHYRQINMLLDRIAYNAADLLISHNYKALPIPASIIIDWQKDIGHLSHKEIGCLAGLGWRGKNNLLINKKYGAAIRLVTVLTNLVLTPSVLVQENCGTCNRCQSSCPVGAIKDLPEKFDDEACFQKVKQFSREIGVGICGLCLAHCPTTASPTK